jgi:hypothetical protein
MELGEDASYLREPPDPQAIPPVAATSLQILPLHALTPANLERLCLRLVEKEAEVEYAGIYGKPGQAQEGIDVLARHLDGKYRLVQSRRIKDLTASGLRQAVSDFLDGRWASKARSFVYATSASASNTKVQDEIAAQAKRLKDQDVAFDVWDDDRFSRKLKDHPDLVVDFFGPDVLRAFLPDQAGTALAQQLVDALAPRIDAISAEVRVVGSANLIPVPGAGDGLLDLALMSGELAPDVREILETLRDTSRTEAAHLASYVGSDPRRARDLIRDPQPWVQRGSWQLHNALGFLANAAGLYSDAERAFIQAQERSPADQRALMLMRARDSAENDERPYDATALFEQARALDDQLIAVRIVEIKATTSLEDQLDELAALTPTNDRERRSISRTRIDVLLDLDRPQEALPLLDEMLAEEPDSIFALDRRAGITYRRAAAVGVSHPSRDPAALREAANDSLKLTNIVRPRGRVREANQLAVRAAECLVLAGDRDAARDALDGIGDSALADAGLRTSVARALLHIGDDRAARSMLGDETAWNDDQRLIGAHTFATSDRHADREQAMQLATPLLRSDEHAGSAALAMLIAATSDTDIPWPTEAADVVAARSPATAAHFEAERLSRDGKDDDAQRLLQQHAGDPNILRQLVERAIDAENWGRALTLAERLFRETARAEDRMLLAAALDGAGHTDRLRQELNAIIADAENAPTLRARAYAALMQQVPKGDFTTLGDLTERWVRDLPDDLEGQWQRTFVLARLARYDEALALIADRQLVAQTTDQAHLLAATYVRTLKPLEAARRIARLSDQFNRSDENLEALLLFTALRTKEPADDALRSRIAETVQTFPERFPQSTAIQEFTVDEDDPHSIIELFQSQFDADHERRRREMFDDVVHGRAALAFLSALISRHQPQIMLRLAQIPLAYGHHDEWKRELELACSAVGNPAVWDPTSLTIAASMPKELRAAVVDALPGSVVAYSSLSECDQADAALTDQDEEHIVSQDGDRLRVSTLSQDELSREREIVHGALELARTLTSVADVSPDEPDEFDEFFEHRSDDEEARLRSFDTFPATLSVARRRGLPLYSDDRYVRRTAHQSRIETFGSIALLSVLAEQDAVDIDAVRQFRLDLLRHGAVGLRPTGTELAQLSAEQDDQPVGEWLASLLDPSAWRNDPDEHLRSCIVFLSRLWDRNPELLGPWAARVLDCISRVSPGTEAFFASVSLVYVWFLIDVYEDDDRAKRHFSTDLIHAFTDAPGRLGIAPFANLAGKAIAIALRFGARHQQADAQRWILLIIVRQLRFPLDAQALAAYWQHV